MKPAPANNRGKQSKYLPHQGKQECDRRLGRPLKKKEMKLLIKRNKDKIQTPSTTGAQNNA